MKCKTCKRPALKNRKRCGPCANKHWRALDPVKACYNNLKAHAKKRGKQFTITLEDFREFCIKTPYMAGKGKTADSYHVDRIDEALGYVPGNLQVLTNRENFKKYLVYDYQTRTGIVRQTGRRAADGENLPF